MQTSAINAALGSNSSLADSEPGRLPIKTLTQQDFLKLLVTQMTAQDPLNPKQDTEFIAQMTQFSALEQSKSMQSDMAQLRSEQQVLQANALLGRSVELNDATTGKVAAVQVAGGTPFVLVNGVKYSLDQITMIAPGNS